MAGEALIARGVVQAGTTAGRTALAEEALAAMQAGRRIANPKGAIDFVDEASGAVLNLIKSGDRTKSTGAWFDYLTQPTAREAMAAIEKLPTHSMSPEAFKVLTVDGFSPNFGKSLQWSLPKLQNGKWTPGAWMDVSHQPFGMNGLYIADDPQRWLRYYGKPGRSALTAFRVQIGDPVSRAVWNDNLIAGMERGNFTAKTIRLLEPLM